MPQIKENNLPDNMTLYFARILQWYESEVKGHPFGLNIKNKNLKSFLEKNKITIKADKSIPESVDPKTFIFKSHKSQCVDLIRHIRNAFAHDNITNNNGELTLKDEYHKKTAMCGCIKFNKLKELITIIQKMKSA